MSHSVSKKHYAYRAAEREAVNQAPPEAGAEPEYWLREATRIYGCMLPAQCFDRGEHTILSKEYDRARKNQRDRYVARGYGELYTEKRRDQMKAPNASLPQNRLEQWMICREPGSGQYAQEPNPKKLYAVEADARRDAEQLARQQERPFYVLKVIAIVRPTYPPLEWVEDE